MTTTARPLQQTPTIAPLQALSRLFEIANGYCVSQAFFTACELGVFEELSRTPASPEDLAGRIKIHPVGCRRLLEVLRHLGLVELKDSLYRNSSLGQHCTSRAPVNLAAMLGMRDPFYHMFEFLPDALREYGPRWQQALGASSNEIFSALYADPARLRQFARMMNAFSIPQGQDLAERFDFTRHHCVMDVAGGPGGLAVQVGVRHRHLRGIIMDMQPVCEVAREHIATCGLQDRFTTAAADLFAGPYPSGADVLILGHILHDWSDENCRKILRNCYQALPPAGVLLVSEKVLNEDHSGPLHALTKDLVMLVACDPGGRERNEAEYRTLLGEAGFRDIKVERIEAPRDLIIARKLSER